MKNLPNADHITYFDKQICYWQVILGLNSWRLERNPKMSSAMADVQIDYGSKLAVYRIGNFGGCSIDKESLSLTALHECLHVLLHDLIRTAQNRGSDEDLDAAEHAVINVLEKVIYGRHNEGI